MAVIRPFRAVRPVPAAAPRVAAVPYDVVDTEEARALAAGNPLSFLHVSRAEIDLPAGTDPHDDMVYRTAAERYRALKREAPLVQETEPSLYLYHLDYERPRPDGRGRLLFARRVRRRRHQEARAHAARTRKTIARATSSSCARRQDRCFWRIVRTRRSTSCPSGSGRPRSR